MKKLLLLLTTCGSMLLSAQTVGLQTFASGFSTPVGITNAGDDRLFVVQRGGLIRIVNPNGTVNATPFISLSSSIVSGGERGLLGLAFHPDYANNGKFYVNYTRSGDGATVIARYNVSSTNPDIADAASGQVLLTIPQPFTNHNGGSVVFGPDGYLYIGTGDGGSGGDPNNAGQNPNTLLGKMLRIDVDSGTLYGIPADNPDIGQANGANEIWATGMRNPWKFSFDRETGDLWIADVGQNAIEEINKAAASEAGLNYGWRCYEGNSPYNTAGCGPAANYNAPIATYNHNQGECSITGGYVYRGSMYPNLVGKYVFSDYCGNRIGTLNNTGGAITWTNAFSGNFVAFGEDVNGELYIAGLISGIISRVVDTSLGTADFASNGLRLFPNPSTNYFTIENNNQLVVQDVSVFDLSGKVLLEKTINASSSIEISTATLQAGLYFVTVTAENGLKLNTKMIVE